MASTVLGWLKKFGLGAAEPPTCNWCRRTASEARPALNLTKAGPMFPTGNEATLCIPCLSEYRTAPDHHELIFVSLVTAPEGEELLRAIPLVKPTILEQCEQITAGTFTRFEITDLAQKLVEFWNEQPPFWVPHGDRSCTWKARLKTVCSGPAATPMRFAALTLTHERLPTKKVATRSQEWVTVIRTGQYLFHAEKRLLMGYHLEEDSAGKAQRL